MKDSDGLAARRAWRAGAARRRAGAFGVALLAAAGAAAQPAGAWEPDTPFGPPHERDPGDRQRERAQLRELLRSERHRPPAPPCAEPLEAAGRERLSPEERDALRRHLRKLAPHRHGP